MSRGGFKIERSGYEYERSEPKSDWLSRFADEYAQKEAESQTTAVEVMRQRKSEPSIFDYMNSIINGRNSNSLYGSVEEAVTDYQKRTGLLDYQKQAMAQEIIDAGKKAVAQEDEGYENPEHAPQWSSVDYIGYDQIKYHPNPFWAGDRIVRPDGTVLYVITDINHNKETGETFVELYAPGLEYMLNDSGETTYDKQIKPLPVEGLRRTLEKNNLYLVKGSPDSEISYDKKIEPLSVEAQYSAEKKTQKPELLEKYPAIETYIHNIIDTQPGIQLPAILHSIYEIFGREGVHETDLDSSDLARYINEIMKSNHNHRISQDPGDSNLGRGIGTDNVLTYEVNDPNRDPFAGLMPKRMF